QALPVRPLNDAANFLLGILGLTRAVHTPHILASRRLDTPPLCLCICPGRRGVRGGRRLHTAPGVTRSTYRRNSLCDTRCARPSSSGWWCCFPPRSLPTLPSRGRWRNPPARPTSLVAPGP